MLPSSKSTLLRTELCEADIGIQRYRNKDMRFNFIQLECTDGIPRGDLPFCSRQFEERCPPRWEIRRDARSQRSLKQRWQSFVVIRIISLDVRQASNTYLRCRVCLFISVGSFYRSSLWSTSSSFMVPHVQRRSEIINKMSRTSLDTLCSPNYSALREIFSEFLYLNISSTGCFRAAFVIDEKS